MNTNYQDKNNIQILFKNIILYQGKKYFVTFDNRINEVSLCLKTDESILIPLKSINKDELLIIK